MKLPAGRPWRPLAGLTLFVLLTHALLLQGLPAPTLSWHRMASAPVQVRAVLSPSAATPMAGEDGLPRATEGPAGPVAAPQPLAREVAGTRTRAERPPPGTSPGKPDHAAAARAPATTPASKPVPDPLIPAPAVWRYEVRAQQRGLPVTGHAQLAWRHDGERYEATLRIEGPALPSRQQRSTGLLDAQGLHPQRFSERVRAEAAAHFDRARGRIVFSTNRPEAPLQPGAQDRLSVLVQLGAAAAADPQRFAAGTVLPVQTAGTREADTWSLVSEGPQALQLPGGAVESLKFTRAPRGEYDPRLELWFGPADYGLVRLRLTAPNGDWLDLQWSGTDKG